MLHQVAAVFAVGLAVYFAVVAPDARSRFAALVFTGSLFTLFTVSATYHRVQWQTAAARAWMRRADHASIFVLIAGSYTPIALVGLPEDLGNRLMLVVWVGAAVGVAQSLFWIHAPKFVAALLAVALGWSVTLYWAEARAALTDTEMSVLLLGGVFYTMGAVAYALKRPKLWPKTFGYHEFFHACTIVAAILHALVVDSVVSRSVG